MQLHQLRLENIGPFVGVTEIDFARFANSGVFLLDGGVGVGKSMIIDSLVFALYGRAAGSESSVDRMRSAFAPAEESSSVRLTFEVASGIYRIERTPAYQRAKRRGEGTTEQRSSIRLYRLADPDAETGELISSRHEEAQDEIQRILGLNREQFVQTVVLPQGQFAEFLRADPSDRQALLQRLFGTDLYDATTDELKRRRSEALALRSASSDQCRRATVAFSTTAELSEDQSEALLQAEPNELRATVAKVVEHGETQAKLLQAELHTRAVQTKQLDDRLQSLRETTNAWNTRHQLHAQAEQLTAQADQIDQLEQTVTRGIALQALTPAFVELQAAQADEHIVFARIEQTRNELAQASDPHGRTLYTDTERVDPQRLLLRVEHEMTATGEALEAENRRADTITAIDSGQDTIARYSDQLTAAREVLAAIPAQREQLMATRNEQFAIGAGLPLAQQQHADAVAARAAAERVVELTVRSRTQQTQLDEAVTSAQKLNQVLATQRHDYLAGMAGNLAAELVDGQPCPVCGSAEHPHPADRLISAAVTQESLDDVDTQVAEAFRVVEQLREALQAVQVELATAQHSAGSQSVEQWTIECERLGEAITYAELAVKKAVECDAELANLDTQQQRAEHASQTAQAGITTTDALLRDTRAVLQQLDSQLSQARGGFERVADRLEVLTEVHERVQRLVTDEAQAVQLRSVVQERSQRFTQQLTALELPDQQAWESEVDALDDLDAHAKLIADYRSRVATVQAQLAADQLTDLPHDDPSELLAQAQAEHEHARAELAALTTAHELATRRSTQLASSSHTLNQAIDEHSATVRQTDAVIRMADLATARSTENQLRTALPTYVLHTRFQQVLTAANERLRELSDGRYALHAQFEPETAARRAGLGLLVYDFHSEQARRAGDLSGGETFYTALSLALGLADVVTAESGGIDLGTLFIDEGFGSLDSQTLDNVLSQITRLSQHGRLVGVISHVDELKHRIADRIEVRRTGAGTSTVAVLA